MIPWSSCCRSSSAIKYPADSQPGRLGAAPSLSIAYTSQGGIYGTIAAGFALTGIPEIREDTSLGRLRTRSDTDKANDRFTSSLAGNMRLVKVSLPAASGVYGVYRAQADTSAALYERMEPGQPYYWRIRHTDGSELYFGEATHGCSNLMREGYAPLTTTRDVFGNEVSYEYEVGVPDECRLKRITWGHNANAALTQPFAKVELAYGGASSCTPLSETWVGAHLDFRTGRRIVTGASKLIQITATAFAFGAEATPSHTRVITLDYLEDKESCSASHAPARLLRSIQESAWGTDAPRVDLPAITFAYGTPAIALTSASTSTVGANGELWNDGGGFWRKSVNLGWGSRAPASAQDKWPTVEAMMGDLNGDGLPDRLFNTSVPEGDGQCKAQWSRNDGPTLSGSPPLTFTAMPGEIILPRLRWRGGGSLAPNGSQAAGSQLPYFESCALNGQATAYRNIIHNSSVDCHPGSTAAYSTTPGLESRRFCYGPGEFGLELPSDTGLGAEFRTYLGYRWLDVTGDGLTDLVAAVHGNIHGYDIVVGNDPFFTGDPTPFGAWPACPQQMDRCKQLDADCLDHALDQASFDVCIANAPSKPCGELTTTIYGMPGKPPVPPTERKPYERCEGLYPWLIYENQGNGIFPTMPRIIYSPVELESATGDSPVMSPFVISKDHAIVDLDGDGVVDAAKLDEAGKNWQVWLGDGTGAFEPRRYVFTRLPRPTYQFSAMDSTSYYGQASSNGEGLVDLNGDGLSEHWSVNAFGANVAFHDGTGFEVAPLDAFGKCYGPCFGAVQVPIMPGDATGFSNPTFDSNGRITGGTAMATKRVIDVDADGRPDVVDAAQTPPQVFFNLGGQLRANTAAYNGNDQGLRRKVVATPEVEDSTQPWEQMSELIDLNGDGIMESAFFDANGLTRNEHASGGSPPRLLITIDNGRGALTRIDYASMHDEHAVEQNANLFWPDGRPKASPSNQWVVRALSTLDSFSSTTSTTWHFYKNPRHGKNDEGRYGFRGFEEVEVTAPSGAKTVSNYDYQVDWSGRLVETRIHPAEALGEVRSIDRTQWAARQAFGGAITTHHVTLREHYTCKNGQTIASCPTDPAGATFTTIAQTAFDAGGPTILWQDTETIVQAAPTLADGDRRTVSTYAIVANPTSYRFRPLATTREHRASGGWLMFGKTAKTWDGDYRVPLTDEVWFDANDANRAITRFVYDMDTGNVIERWKPEQNAASSTKTTFGYDSRKLMVASETNELGHFREYLYEYGTGTKLTTKGPNEATCPINCPAGQTCLPKEQHAIRVDGIGREIEQWDTISDDGCTYFYHQRSTTSYVEPVLATSTPASITNKVRIDVETSVWTEEKTEIDGHGRPIKKTTFVQGTAPADQISTFAYDTNGNLIRVEVPDPAANSAARVAYTYGYDSLGRATSLRRPDATAEADKSGVDIVYDGLTTTTTEETGIAGGNEASTRAIKDRFGRLVQVEERTQISPTPSWTTTTYSYGPDDQVTSVVDPEGVTTALVHDFAGHRTRITRHGRTWCYGYDRNGNVVSEYVPGPGAACTDINYLTSIVYDDLDRALSKVVGQRDLSAADQALFGGNTEAFFYDAHGNMKGHFDTWQSFGPGASVPTVQLQARVDNQGRRTYTGHTLRVADYPALTRDFYQNYYLFGGSRLTYYYDQVASGGNATLSWMSYDARGLPSSAWIFTGTGPIQYDVAVQTRNVAGLVTRRRSSPPIGGPMSYVESNWAYDALGRVVSQVVSKDPAPSAIASQVLQYNGNDDPSWLDTTLGTTSRPLQFMYDHRHQLKTVSPNVAGFFGAAYEYGEAGRFSRVWESQTITPTPEGTEVKSRYVDYRYEGQDPEQVTRLVDVDLGTTYASFTYDEAGNQRTRCLGPSTPTCTAELLEYVYDGKDQLRRVTKKLAGVVQGSEEYWYDGFGSRIAIVRRDAAGDKTELVTFTGDTEAHYDGSGAIEHVYAHVSLGTPVARVKRTGNTTTETEYQFHGLASSTLAAVAADGTVNASFVYTPFGSVAEATNAGGDSNGVPAHERRHNDKFVDQLSELAYYGARYYDRTLLGWTSADPLYLRVPDAGQMSSPRRASIYSFSLQNPMRYMDPDGLDPGAPGAPSPLSSYKSEMEVTNQHRATLEADADWTLKFGSRASFPGLARADLGCPAGMTSFGGSCGLSDEKDARDYLDDVGASDDTKEWMMSHLSDRHWATDVTIAVAIPVVVVLATAAVPLLAGPAPQAVGAATAAAGPELARQLGRAGETAVRAAYNIGDKVKILVNGRSRIPDGLTNTVLSEVKNVKSLSFTRQLRDFADFAQQTGRRFDLYVRPNTTLSGPLQEAVQQGTINLRFIP